MYDTAVDLKKKVAGIVMKVQPQPPDGWEKKFIIHLGETPWWEAENREEKYRAYCRQWARMWDKFHPGVDTETLRRYNKRHPEANARRMRLRREEHPEYNAEALKRFGREHPGYFNEASKRYSKEHPEARAEAMRRFHKTPGGRAALAKHEAKRREHSTSPSMFAARVLQLRANKEPCAECSASYDKTHQVDHIIALCLGGTDNWDNLQPLCISCHRRKTKNDAQKYKEKGKCFSSIKNSDAGTNFSGLRRKLMTELKIC